MDQEQYQKDLEKRQKEHLERVLKNQNDNFNWRPCLHDQCAECVGTGIKLNGSACIHFLSCACPKCSPQYICVTSSKNLDITTTTTSYVIN